MNRKSVCALTETMINLVNDLRKKLEFARYSEFLKQLKGLLDQNKNDELIKHLGDSLLQGATSSDFRNKILRQLCDCLSIARFADEKDLYAHVLEIDSWHHGTYWAHDAIMYFRGISDNYVIDESRIKVALTVPNSETSIIPTLEVALVKSPVNSAAKIFPSAKTMSFLEVASETAESFTLGLDYAVEFLKLKEIRGYNLRWKLSAKKGQNFPKIAGESFAAAFSLLCVRLLQSNFLQEE